MTSDDLLTIREALAYYQRFFGVDPAALPAVEALTVLDRLEGQVLEILRGGEALQQRLRGAIDELYRLNDADVEVIADRLASLHREHSEVMALLRPSVLALMNQQEDTHA